MTGEYFNCTPRDWQSFRLKSASRAFFMLKPYTVADLLKNVRELLDKGHEENTH